MVRLYLRSFPGFTVSSLDPREFPMISEPVISATAWTAVQCCLERPLVGRFSRILVRWTSFPVTVLMATDVRTLCPPPSPLEQSISSMLSFGLYVRVIKKYPRYGMRHPTICGERYGANAGIRTRVRGLGSIRPNHWTTFACSSVSFSDINRLQVAFKMRHYCFIFK